MRSNPISGAKLTQPIRFWQVRLYKGDDFGVNADSWRVFVENHSPQISFRGPDAEENAREVCSALRLFEKFWHEKYENIGEE